METAQIVKTSAFSYKGFEIPALDVPTDLINNLEPGEPAYLLAPKSAPLAWWVGLYTVGRDFALGEADAKALPEPIRQAGRMIYKECQARKRRGVWHKDGIIFEPEATISGSVRPGKDYVAARFFKDIDGFEKIGDVWQIKPSSETREERVWVPEGSGNYMVPGNDGTVFDPRTGLPVETEIIRYIAIKRWVNNTELSPEQAVSELSRFFRGSGTRAVYSWSNNKGGPLCVSVKYEPRSRYSDSGSLALRRSAERSEAQQE